MKTKERIFWENFDEKMSDNKEYESMKRSSESESE